MRRAILLVVWLLGGLGNLDWQKTNLPNLACAPRFFSRKAFSFILHFIPRKMSDYFHRNSSDELRPSDLPPGFPILEPIARLPPPPPVAARRRSGSCTSATAATQRTRAASAVSGPPATPQSFGRYFFILILFYGFLNLFHLFYLST